MLRRIVVTLLIASFLVGCRSTVERNAIITYDRDIALQLSEVPFEGQYTLYRKRPGEEEAMEIHALNLAPPARVGFSNAADGSVYAHAGELKFVLPSGSYEWKGAAEEMHFDAAKTAILVTSIVVGVIIILLIINHDIEKSGGVV